MKYYAITAKCGHVGYGKYYPNTFFVAGDDIHELTQKVRMAPRVKHDHPDAILEAKEISEDQYLAGIEDFKNNPYNHMHSKQEQASIIDELKPYLVDDDYAMNSPRIHRKDIRRKQAKEENRKKSLRYGSSRGSGRYSDDISAKDFYNGCLN